MPKIFNSDLTQQKYESHLCWLEGYPSKEGQRLELENVNLDNLQLTESNLSHSHITNCSLRRINLRASILYEAVLRESDFSNANFYYANLDKADLIHCNLTNADLRYSILTCDLTGAYLTGARLNNCVGNGKEVKSAQLGEYRLVYTKTTVFLGCKTFTLDEILRNRDSLRTRFTVKYDLGLFNKHYSDLIYILTRFPAD